MPRKAVIHEQEYLVTESMVRLSVAVGDRQYGSSVVVVDDEPVANGDVEELPLGRGDSLDGRSAVVYTVVTDIRGKSEEMSVTWILTGGSRRSVVTKDGPAAKNFGSQMFKAIIHFRKSD